MSFVARRRDQPREIYLEPYATSVLVEAGLYVPPSEDLYDVERFGRGHLLYVMHHAPALAPAQALKPRIVIDGKQAFPRDNTMTELAQLYFTTYSLGIRLSKWDETNHFYNIITMIPYSFRTSFKIGFFNASGTTSYSGGVAYIWETI